MPEPDPVSSEVEDLAANYANYANLLKQPGHVTQRRHPGLDPDVMPDPDPVSSEVEDLAANYANYANFLRQPDHDTQRRHAGLDPASIAKNY